MKNLITKCVWVFIGLFTLSGCKDDPSHDNKLLLISDFRDGKDGWQGDFSEYNGNQEDSYELAEELAMLPEPLDGSKQAYRISGMNRSDNLFMYLTRKIDGLEPNTLYRASFSMEIASDAITGGVGAGGAPGEAVGVGIGLTDIPPVSEPDEDNFYRMNIDKINQCCTDGEDMIVIGDVANGTSDPVYTLIQRSGEFSAVTNDQGELWVIVGTDSGYEGKTDLYYSTIQVLFERL